jgi:DNA polymerase III subunit epsilon
MPGDEDSARMIQRLEEAGDHRVLRRVQLQTVPATAVREDTTIAAVVDVETTGLDHPKDTIIELCIRRFRFDAAGGLTKLDRAYSWFEASMQPLSPEIIRLTGLTDEQIAGQSIDEELATALLKSADVIIAHNAAFDRPFIEARLPQVAGMPWACSCNDIDWPSLGFEGKGLGWLLAQSGWFHAGHRAQADVDATIALLCHKLEDDRTPLAALIEAASKESWIVRAVGAHFDTKDCLKARGYRWDSGASMWCRELSDNELEDERAWLSVSIYGPNCRARAEAPLLERVTWRTRYIGRK